MTRTTSTFVLRSRRRPLLGLASAAVLTLGGLTLPVSAASAATSTDATAADEASVDCPTTFPEASVQPGQSVHGLTVSQGTTPETFTGSVVGVLDDGIQPGTDMIIMTLHSTAIDAVGGIWEGMSGSPVYDDATGQLIGAVSYGLSSGPSVIAGITPYAAMTRYLPGGGSATAGQAAPKKITVDNRALTTRIAHAAAVPTADASSFTRLGLATLKGAAAGRGRTLTTAEKSKHVYAAHYLASAKMGAAGGGAATPGPGTLVPGGNVAAATVWGDVTEAGVGTVTATCHGGLVAFGHPMNASGDTSMALLTADALAIQPDPFAPFKLANLGRVAGTITKDGFTGIGGPVGKAPASATFTSTSSYRGTARTGTSHASVPDYDADGAFGEVTVNNDAVLDAVKKGGALVSYTVRGTVSGTTFTLRHTDRYTSTEDISYDSSWDIGDLVEVLSQLPGVKIASVTTKSALDDVTQNRTVAAVQQRRGGRWVKVSQKNPVAVTAGRHAQLRVVLSGSGGERYVTASIWAPWRLKGTQGTLSALGGGDTYADVYDASTFAQLQKALAGKTRNDAVRVDVRVRHQGVAPLKKTVTLGPVDRVLYGEIDVPFSIR